MSVTAAAAVVAVLVLVALPLYVFPETVSPDDVEADVALVPGPSLDSRVGIAVDLIEGGQVSAVLLMWDPTGDGADTLPEWKTDATFSVSTWIRPDGLGEGGTTVADELCASPPAGVECFVPDPYTTRGEVEYLAERMDDEVWDSAVIVTHAAQLNRAQLIARQCGLKEVASVSSTTSLTWRTWANQVVYQTGAFAKAIAQPACSG